MQTPPRLFLKDPDQCCLPSSLLSAFRSQLICRCYLPFSQLPLASATETQTIPVQKSDNTSRVLRLHISGVTWPESQLLPQDPPTRLPTRGALSPMFWLCLVSGLLGQPAVRVRLLLLTGYYLPYSRPLSVIRATTAGLAPRVPGVNSSSSPSNVESRGPVPASILDPAWVRGDCVNVGWLWCP